MCVCVTVFKLMMLLVLSLLSALEFQPPSPILVCKSQVRAVLSGVPSLCSESLSRCKQGEWTVSFGPMRLVTAEGEDALS